MAWWQRFARGVEVERDRYALQQGVDYAADAVDALRSLPDNVSVRRQQAAANLRNGTRGDLFATPEGRAQGMAEFVSRESRRNGTSIDLSNGEVRYGEAAVTLPDELRTFIERGW